MSAQQPPFQPSTVTKPIQLLAAWLIGLVAVDSAFLASSALISKPEWAAGALVIAAILNVPLFIVALFLLQTKFRPEMQEDTYYSKYLDRRSDLTGKIEKIQIEKELIEAPLLEARDQQPAHWHRHLRVRTQRAEEVRISLNDLLPEASAIRKELAAEGIVIKESFGSTSEKAEEPENKVIAIGPECSVPIIQSVIRVAHAHGVNGIARVNDARSDDEGRIYIGAYSFEPGERSFQHLDKMLLDQLLKPGLNERTLEELIELSEETE